MIVNKDLEKEVALAEDLQAKLDNIEGKKSKRPRKAPVSQEVVSPSDADKKANVGEMEQIQQKLVDLEKTTVVAYPDATLHKNISLVKSGVRIAAGLAIAGAGWLEMNPYMQAGGILLVVAEILGIAEELV